jgi:multisubunit Na+/H+ antiporter MnhG subunit
MLLPFVSPIAWYLGAKARREMARHPGVYSDSGKLTAGVTLGVIGTVFALLGVAFIVLLILLAIGIS